MATKGLWVVLTIPLLLASMPLPGEQEKEQGLRKQASETEIKKLIADLGEDSFKTRENATKALAEIGLPAMNALRQAAAIGDFETKSRARRLMDRIRFANVKPVEVNGMQFKTDSSFRWTRPNIDKGIGTAVGGGDVFTTEKIVLSITNLCNDPKSFYLQGVKPKVSDSKGQSVLPTLWRLTPVLPDDVSPPLRKGEPFILSYECGLMVGKRGFEFYFKDRFSNLWTFLVEEEFFLSLSYQNKMTLSRATLPLWTGEFGTPAQQILIE